MTSEGGSFRVGGGGRYGRLGDLGGDAVVDIDMA